MPNYLVIDADWLDGEIGKAETLRAHAQSTGKPVAIAAAGMLHLARQLDNGEQMRQHAETLLGALNSHKLEIDSVAQGLLRGGTYNASKNWGVDEYFICGDYYFLEALLMREGACPDFWGPTQQERTGK